MTCMLCGTKMDDILEVFDPEALVCILDFWCPQCHATETRYCFIDGSVAIEYIKGM